MSTQGSFATETLTLWPGSIFEKRSKYFKRQKRYAQGSTGFVCRDAARSNGYRRSLLGLR
jgi:hypothetical protein